MGHVVVERGAWVRPQKPSLLVVLGSGPVYTSSNDIRFGRHAQFFANPEVQAVRHSWLVAPFGAANYTSEQLYPQARVFDAYQEFFQTYRPTPRSVTDWTQGNADIFVGNDTYGWPPPPVPEYWSPQSQGTTPVLNSFPPYVYATDVFLLRPPAKYFSEPEVYFRGQQPMGAVNYLYTQQLDQTLFRQSAKVFDEFVPFWTQSQPITANILNFTPTYNPATDVTFFRTQAKYFAEFEPFFRGQVITQNVLIFLPRPYDYRGDFKFRTPDRYFPPIPDFGDNFTQKYSFEVIVNRLTPPPPPPPLPGQFVLPSFLGIDWYEASFEIIELGLIQNKPPKLVQTGVYPPGTVVAQYPPAGIAVFPNTDIHLTVEFEFLLGAAYDLNVNKFPW
jgi:hypothetical protein